MRYDPFARGQFPVGVRTIEVTREARTLPIEVWYPATDDYAGRDVDPGTRDTFELIPGLPPGWQDAVRDATSRPGRHPFVAFSHGYGGHRRQSTFLCTHLASHGYVVAAVDHTGNTVLDVMQVLLGVMNGVPIPDPGDVLREFIAARPADVSFMIDHVLEGAGKVGADPERVGMAGHSFGGWTTLATAARDPRVRAAFPLAPAGGASPLPAKALQEGLDLRWQRDVPTLFVVADRDTLLPLRGMHEIYERLSSTKRMVVLKNADHMHFCDRVEEVHEMFRLMPQDPVFAPIQGSVPPITELCPGEHALTAIRALGLAHMDAHLRGDERAAAFLGGDVRGVLAERGVAVDVV
ncbi:MAG TPA: dienelactone hydrolase family protein [Candidatus Binatia bacterium]|nr:dienelactone hydrolase family protein [Candidatus Binatia bacterium]